MPEQAGFEPVAAAPAISQSENSTAPQAAAHLEAVDRAPSIAPDHEAPKADAPKPDESKAEVSKAELPKIEASKIDASKIDAPKIDAAKTDVPKIDAPAIVTRQPDAERKREPAPSKLVVMAPAADRSRRREDFAPRGKAEENHTPNPRRFAAAAAVIAVASLVGAVSGALATAGAMHFSAKPAPSVVNTSALEASVARIDADIVALKANLDHAAKIEAGQFNKASERLEKLEKAQAEPAAKLAKLSEAVDKLRTAQASTPAKEVTGSVPQAQAAAAVPPKADVGRLPTVEGWRLRDVGNGSALIEGRTGLYEVYAGDPVPGLGRIDAIRRQDGRWVVVTSRGLIVGR